MKAAMVVTAGQTPVYGDFSEPASASSSTSAAGKVMVSVTAASISHVTKSRASGRHYSAGGALPFIPGIDGAGVTGDGRRVYFMLPEHPYGSMAERCLVDAAQLVALPDGLSDRDAAAMAIPGMSSWAALVERAHLVAGETVLINGATGASGRLAIQIARRLGAKKVIATGRQVAAFDELRALGADATIALGADRQAMEQEFKRVFHDGVDIVLDYLWGPSAEAIVVAAAKAGPEGRAIRYVQIGAIAGGEISLPGAALRSSALQMMGSGIGSVPFPRLVAAIGGVLTAAPAAGFKIASVTAPLSEVNRVWDSGDAESRIVLIP